ncbi:MAG: hypothetical protein J6C46_06320 [Clostridia bacterium]|nr:hypothetical protein [Clostridia bacterium]
MLKSNRGSITMMAYVAMLFFSLYGAIVFGNASRKYNIQTDEIKTIQNAYDFQMNDQELYRLYYNIGSDEIRFSR